MTTDDPWSSISPPARNSLLSARRVTQTTPWGLYWAVDADNNLLLILQHRKGVRRTSRLPRFRGLRVEASSAELHSDERILIRLTDREQRDIFLRFCRDIVDATILASTEEQAIERFLARTWRWHRLLQGDRDKRLSDEEQKGLIGELFVLERHLLPVLRAAEAVRCWTGPLDAPHDFEISKVHVEAKARGSSVPHVNISSEFQLESNNADILFLHVTEVLAATEGTANACTVTDIANRIRSVMAQHDMVAVELFEERLDLVGFNWTDDYSDKLWLFEGSPSTKCAKVSPGSRKTMYPAGVDNVRYAISLSDCEAFRVDPAALGNAVAEVANVC